VRLLTRAGIVWKKCKPMLTCDGPWNLNTRATSSRVQTTASGSWTLCVPLVYCSLYLSQTLPWKIVLRVFPHCILNTKNFDFFCHELKSKKRKKNQLFILWFAIPSSFQTGRANNSGFDLACKSHFHGLSKWI